MILIKKRQIEYGLNIEESFKLKIMRSRNMIKTLKKLLYIYLNKKSKVPDWNIFKTFMNNKIQIDYYNWVGIMLLIQSYKLKKKKYLIGRRLQRN